MTNKEAVRIVEARLDGKVYFTSTAQFSNDSRKSIAYTVSANGEVVWKTLRLSSEWASYAYPMYWLPRRLYRIDVDKKEMKVYNYIDATTERKKHKWLPIKKKSKKLKED